jgi:membrane carboxypeptidase/penicillin-binding protein
MSISKHSGFNPVAMVNAVQQNRKAGKVVRGGSTLTTSSSCPETGKGRTYFEKIIELILATRLELGYSKNEILNCMLRTLLLEEMLWVSKWLLGGILVSNPINCHGPRVQHWLFT